jgi:hypothetical protein
MHFIRSNCAPKRQGLVATPEPCSFIGACILLRACLNNKVKVMKWKDKLLSSGVPLEYQISRILTEHHFSVSSEYKYLRLDLESGHDKEFSVDISALGFTPFNDENECDSSVHLLVECKYRHEFKGWCFFPETNQPDYSNFTLGRTIRVIDEFSYWQIDSNSTVPFDENLDCCFKGVEIDFKNDIVTDSDIQRGLSQLQYALPRLFIESILYGGGEPVFLVPILVTSCKLYLFSKRPV